jgi:predicted nicotinamide N-methyase
VRSGTSWAAVPFVPEIRLLTAAEPFGLWDLSERDAPPFWAFPWAGGQALARYLLDHPDTVRGRHVLDGASGSGLVAIAAAKAGAASVTACDVDPNAVAAIAINALTNETAAVTARVLDLADLAVDDPPRAQVVLAADVFYQREFAAVALRFLRRAAGSGADVLAADPGRAFLPASNLTPLTSYQVPVLSVLEDALVKRVTIYRVSLRATPELSTAAAAGRGRRAAPGTAPRRPPRQAGSSHRRSGPCRTPGTRARSGSTRR